MAACWKLQHRLSINMTLCNGPKVSHKLSQRHPSRILQLEALVSECIPDAMREYSQVSLGDTKCFCHKLQRTAYQPSAGHQGFHWSFKELQGDLGSGEIRGKGNILVKAKMKKVKSQRVYSRLYGGFSSYFSI